jgi:long-chain acyl-CoA synthetase
VTEGGVVARDIVLRRSLSRTPSTDKQVRSDDPCEMTNLSLFLTESADMYPDAPALRFDGATTTYSELADEAASFAAYLADQGVRPGDRVGVMLANRPEFAVAFYGVMYAGAIAVPMNPLLSAREVQFVLTNTGARLLFFAPPCVAAATTAALAADVPHVAVDTHMLAQLTAEFLGPASPVSRAVTDNAVILHTSGATGVPKGAVLTHGNLLSNQAVVARTVLNLEPVDVVMCCVPLHDAFGMTCGLVATVSTGATLALLPGFDPDNALKTIAAEGVTVFEGTPTMYAAMLDVISRRDLSFRSLRVAISCGAAMPSDVVRRFEEKFGCVVLEGYGLCETSAVVCSNHRGAARKPGSIGTPIDGVQMRVVDEHGSEVPTGATGRIQVRGDNVMKGYWNASLATVTAIVDGWFYTGDTGHVDADGYVFIVDRGKGRKAGKARKFDRPRRLPTVNARVRAGRTLFTMSKQITGQRRVTPLGVLVRGAVAGAVGTVAMDLLLYVRYRRGGGKSGLTDWEFSAGLDSWDDAPAPAIFGRRVFEGVFQRQLPPQRARLVNNVVHWATGVGWGDVFGLLIGSLAPRRAWYGLLFGAGVWLQSYAVLSPAKLYKPIWDYDAETLWHDLSAHLVYGLATATAFRVLARGLPANRR